MKYTKNLLVSAIAEDYDQPHSLCFFCCERGTKYRVELTTKRFLLDTIYVCENCFENEFEAENLIPIPSPK